MDDGRAIPGVIARKVFDAKWEARLKAALRLPHPLAPPPKKSKREVRIEELMKEEEMTREEAEAEVGIDLGNATVQAASAAAKHCEE